MSQEREAEYYGLMKDDDDDLLSRSIMDGEKKRRRGVKRLDLPADEESRRLFEGSEIMTVGMVNAVETVHASLKR